MHLVRLTLLTLVSGAILTLPCLADLPSPRFDRLTPLGAAAGSSVEIEVAGADIEDVKTLLFDNPGLKAEYLKDRRFRLTVAANVPPGTYDVRLIGRYGVSNPRLFAVSQGLTDVAEKEPNDEAASAQVIAINSAVNGMSDGNRDDVFRFPAKRGQRIVIACHAQKLDSDMDATLVLHSADGKQLASNGDYHGRDPFLDLVAPQDGDYLVSVHDLSYRGGQPYRLIVSDRPQVENVFPRAVQAGRPTSLTVYGRNLGSAARPSSWRSQDLALEEYAESVTAPADLLTQGAYRFLEHPTDHSALPTAATCTLTGFQFQPRPGGTFASPVPLLVTDSPVTHEVEPNDDASKPQMIQLPAVISGRFDRERDADWYEFESAANGPHAFEVYCERIAGRADPYLVVMDDKGNRVSELDDFGQRMNAFDGHLRDPSGMVNLSAKRRYRVLVQDRYRRGGARFQYVLVIRQPVPDFYVAAIHHQNPGPSGINVRRGGSTVLDLVIHHTEGFRGPITLTAEGLPRGLHAQPTTLRDTRGSFVFWADRDAADWIGPVKLIATGKRGDSIVRREVRPYTRVWAQANVSSSRPTRELVLALRESAPFALRFDTERLEVKARSKAEVKLHVDRLWPDLTNTMTIQPLSFPGQFRMSNVEIPGSKKEATLSIDIQAGTPPGEYTLAVTGQAQVPFSKDAGKPKANTLVSQPSRPITLVVQP